MTTECENERDVGKLASDHPKYRADIDGLRAIAVLSVVGFHASPGVVKGGLVGVDIFFVISGFLICSIIFGGLDQGTFSITKFYSRRVRRIFPALIVVLVACYAFGWFVLFPDEFRQLGKHIAAGAAFISNIALWREAGYFDNAAGVKPLLHLWSLGIEEQFYILWPLLLLFISRRGIGLLSFTVFFVVISFAINVLTINTDMVATFYLPLTRMWELLVGSVIAYVMLQNGKYAKSRQQPQAYSFRPVYSQKISASA